MSTGEEAPVGGMEIDDAVIDRAGDPNGPFATTWSGLAALKKRLFAADNRLSVVTSEHLENNYYFTWLRTLAVEDVQEDVADDGWGVVVAERPGDMIGVFGSCSLDACARVATASFCWDEVVAAGDRNTRKRGSGSARGPPIPTMDTKNEARTGALVVFEHQGMYMRGLALWFVLYLPPTGEGVTPLMPEFKNQVVVFAYVYVAALARNGLVVSLFGTACSIAPPLAHEPPFTGQAVYTSKNEKLDGIPHGVVRDNGKIHLWDGFVQQFVGPEKTSANCNLWSDAVGMRNEASRLAFDVSVVSKSSSDLKKLGMLTNSLRLAELDHTGRPLQEVSGQEGTMRMFVSARPDNLREFMKHCDFADAPVVEEWAKEAMTLVGTFDYQVASLQQYARAELEIPGVEVHDDPEPGPKRKGKGVSRGSKITTRQNLSTAELCHLLNSEKGNHGEDAGRVGMRRLYASLNKHKGAWANFEPSPADIQWLQTMDLVLKGLCGNLPAWIVCQANTNTFKAVATFRAERMGEGGWAWTQEEKRAAIRKWLQHIGSEEASSGSGSDNEVESSAGHANTAKKKKRSAARKAEPNKKGKGRDALDSHDAQSCMGELNTNLLRLTQASQVLESAVKHHQPPASAAAAGSGEQGTSDLQDKLQVALHAVNHLVQDFHQRKAIRSPCITGLITILKAKFESHEIKAVLKETDLEEFLS